MGRYGRRGIVPGTGVRRAALLGSPKSNSSRFAKPDTNGSGLSLAGAGANGPSDGGRATEDGRTRLADSRPDTGFAPTDPHSVSALDSTGSVAARGLVAVTAATRAAPLLGVILEPAIALALQDKIGREVSVS